VTRLSSWWAGVRPLLRVARRDALRARGRSALIVAMIALPILALTAADVLARSAQLEPDEEVSRRLGQTQAELAPAYVSGPVLQAPDPRLGLMVVGEEDAGDGAAYADPAQLVAAAPAGYEVLTSESGEVVTRTREGVTRTEWNETDVGHPAFEGRYVVRDGSAPGAGGEVAVTSDLFDRLGVEVGGTVTLQDPAGTFTLAGVVDQIGRPATESYWAMPGTLLDDEIQGTSVPTAFLAGDRAVTWEDVLALNERALTVSSRAVLLDPPADAEVPFYAQGNDPAGSGDTWFFVLGLAVVVALAALEVTLLAGAAFAVGARRQARTLGLLAAAGGSRRHVRAVVLSGGVVLGAAGALVGIVLGLLLAVAARPVLTDLAGADFGRFDVRPLELLAIAALGVGTGLLAALLPARTAARQDPVVALTGRRGQVRTAKRVPAIGVALTVIGVGAAALGSALAVARTTGASPIGGGSTALVAGLVAGGAALAQIGLIVTSPAIIGLAARWAGRLPLPGRLALRDAARHRGRSAPAMAAVLTAVTGSTALLLYVASLDAQDRERYQPSWPEGSGAVGLLSFDYDQATGTERTTREDPDRVLAAIRSELPPFQHQVVTSTIEGCIDDVEECTGGWAEPLVPAENECFLWSLEREPTTEEYAKAEQDPRCSDQGLTISGSFSGTPVGGAEVLEIVTGQPVPDGARQVLGDGGVIVFSPNMMAADGTVTFDVVTGEEQQAADEAGREPQATQVRLPAAYLDVGSALADRVYSPVAAQKLGLAVKPSTVLIDFDRLPTTGEEEAAAAAMEQAGLRTYLDVERGYQSGYGLGLLALVVGAGVITLGAAGIATGLAQADARADHATLAAVGAAPRLRRSLAAAQAVSIAGLGTALGIAAGFVPALALIGAAAGLDLVIPWWQLAQVMVVVPLLAGGSAWLLTRSRVPLDRRVA
jgi:putative ABC transport system permease protein